MLPLRGSGASALNSPVNLRHGPAPAFPVTSETLLRQWRSPAHCSSADCHPWPV